VLFDITFKDNKCTKMLLPLITNIFTSMTAFYLVHHKCLSAHFFTMFQRQ